MKFMFLAILFMVGSNAVAAVDLKTRVFIVTSDGDEGYEVESAPANFCVGVVGSTLATAVVQPVVINVAYGCGTSAVATDINEASCVQVKAEETTITRKQRIRKAMVTHVRADITADLSACGEKREDPKFRTAVEEAIRKTYAEHTIRIMSLTLK
jgi:hypothetical protein